METKTINEIQNEIIEELEPLEDWMDRYQVIIEYGKDLEEPNDEDKNLKNLIQGCQSRVWIVTEQRDGRLYFKADSDALIVKGIAAMLIRIVNGQKAEDIAKANLYIIEKLQLTQHLSPTRSNGLFAMIQHIKRVAIEMVTKQ